MVKQHSINNPIKLEPTVQIEVVVIFEVIIFSKPNFWTDIFVFEKAAILNINATVENLANNEKPRANV